MTDFENPDYYINRELGLLAFNSRVLELAQDKRMPLLERLRFLCISSSNLDEFFEVRVGSLKQQQLLDIYACGADGLMPGEALKRIAELSKNLVEQQYSLLNKVMIPALKKEGIHFARRTHWDDVQRQWLSDYFDNELMPLLSPFGLDPAHPFPNVINKSLNFITELDGTDAFGRKIRAAIVQAPRTLPRIIRLPADIAPSENTFVFLSSILHAFIDRLFPGMTVDGCYQFRVTRNSNMYVDEEEIDDLLKAMKGELPHRNFGAAVRLEVADHCSETSFRYLQKHFELDDQDVYQVDGPVNLNRLMKVIDLIDKPKLRFAPFMPGSTHAIKKVGGNIFKAIRHRDILSHYPYQSFNTMLKLLDQAAKDDDVLAIKLTLYRAGENSAL
ncbi:MAG: Polyphosphate kinase (EC, partial [uncultured Thiotrichaceae bacterium]